MTDRNIIELWEIFYLLIILAQFIQNILTFIHSSVDGTVNVIVVGFLYLLVKRLIYDTILALWVRILHF